MATTRFESESKDIDNSKSNIEDQFNELVSQLEKSASWGEQHKLAKHVLAELAPKISLITWKTKVTTLLKLISDQVPTSQAIKSINLLATLGPIMPWEVRSLVLTSFVNLLESSSLKNSAIRKELQRSFAQFGDSVPDKLRFEVVVTLVTQMSQHNGDIEIISTALVPFWEPKFLSIVPDVILPTLFNINLALAKQGYMLFMLAATTLEKMHCVSDRIPHEKKEEIIKAIKELEKTYGNTDDYQDLAKAWCAPPVKVKADEFATKPMPLTIFAATSEAKKEKAVVLNPESEKRAEAKP